MTFKRKSIEQSREIVSVAVALPVHRLYTYAIPEHLRSQARPGKRVLIPFGARTVTGYLLGNEKEKKEFEIKHLLDVLDDSPLFPVEMIPFFRWIADYYMHPIGQVISTALPSGLNLSDKAVMTLTQKGMRAFTDEKTTPLEKTLLKALSKQTAGFSQLEQLAEQSISRALVYQMRKRGWIRIDRQITTRQVRSKTIRLVAATRFSPPTKSLSAQRNSVLAELKKTGEMNLSVLVKKLQTTPSLIRAMKRDGQVSIVEKAVYRDPFGDPIEPDEPPVLTREQKNAIDRMEPMLGEGFKTILLAGVTGSGKTEVYLRLAASTLQKGLSVLVLVPEIALISQTERRFRARFGKTVAVLHSGLTRGERYDQWLRIAKGQAGIAIGARSCIFAPFQKIGLIIVDEEHDASYKQEGGLHYNGRDLAVIRARQNGALAVLGSATPSIQSYHNATIGKYGTVSLSRRINRQPLPLMETVDLSKNRDVRGVYRYITATLKKAIQETLEAGQQALIFLNRRGFSAFPTCAHCGQPIRCNNCDISLTLHKKANAFRCHYCGFSKSALSKCIACGSDNIKLLGVGTEKIHESVEKLFPDARVARMDRDTVTRKGAMVKLLKGLKSRQIDILIGTQMIAKGHDFPGITLVGVICADLSLNFPDFRAGERTFQLLAQVAGRAGRGSRPGRVILQTYNPDHFAILSAKEQNFEAFFSKEIDFRKTLGYPPFTRMIAVHISGKDQQQVVRVAGALGESCRQFLSVDGSRGATIQMMGPVEAPLSRIANRHRWQILLKSPDTNRLHGLVKKWILGKASFPVHRRIKISIDVDPFFLM